MQVQVVGYFGAHRTAQIINVSDELWNQIRQAHEWVRTLNFDPVVDIWGDVDGQWCEVHVYRQDCALPATVCGVTHMYSVSIPR